MNKQRILLILLMLSLLATAGSIRTFSFAHIDTSDLAVMTGLSVLDFVLWGLWRRSTEE